MIPLLTGVICAVLGLLVSPVLRRFLEADSPRVASLRLPVAALAALAGVGAARVSESIPELVAFSVASVGCALLVMIDLVVRRLPDVLVASTSIGLLVPLTVAAATTGEWPALGRSLLAAVVLLTGYFLLAFIAPAGLGLGDVKFAAVIGAFLGWFGWSEVALGTVLGFVINGVLALGVLVSGRGDRTSDVPFGPSMILGAVIGVALNL